MRHEIYINDGKYVLINRGRVQEIAIDIEPIVLKIKEQEKELAEKTKSRKTSTSKGRRNPQIEALMGL